MKNWYRTARTQTKDEFVAKDAVESHNAAYGPADPTDRIQEPTIYSLRTGYRGIYLVFMQSPEMAEAEVVGTVYVCRECGYSVVQITENEDEPASCDCCGFKG